MHICVHRVWTERTHRLTKCRTLSDSTVYRHCRETLRFYRSSADGLVMAEAAVPHGAGDEPGEKEPAGLDGERLPKFRAAQALQENRDRTKQFVIKRHPFQRRLNSGRHDVDRKHLAS